LLSERDPAPVFVIEPLVPLMTPLIIVLEVESIVSAALEIEIGLLTVAALIASVVPVLKVISPVPRPDEVAVERVPAVTLIALVEELVRVELKRSVPVPDFVIVPEPELFPVPKVRVVPELTRKVPAAVSAIFLFTVIVPVVLSVLAEANVIDPDEVPKLPSEDTERVPPDKLVCA